MNLVETTDNISKITRKDCIKSQMQEKLNVMENVLTELYYDGNK